MSSLPPREGGGAWDQLFILSPNLLKTKISYIIPTLGGWGAWDLLLIQSLNLLKIKIPCVTPTPGGGGGRSGTSFRC